jgi:hypothetical protein
MNKELTIGDAVYSKTVPSRSAGMELLGQLQVIPEFNTNVDKMLFLDTVPRCFDVRRFTQQFEFILDAQGRRISSHVLADGVWLHALRASDAEEFQVCENIDAHALDVVMLGCQSFNPATGQTYLATARFKQAYSAMENTGYITDDTVTIVIAHGAFTTPNSVDERYMVHADYIVSGDGITHYPRRETEQQELDVVPDAGDYNLEYQRYCMEAERDYS